MRVIFWRKMHKEDQKMVIRIQDQQKEIDRLKVLTETLEKEKETANSNIEELTEMNAHMRQETLQAMKEREAVVVELNRLRQVLDESLSSKEKLAMLEVLNKELTSIRDATTAEMSNLTALNAALIGHSNHKQKIKLHLKVKEENNNLKLEKTKLLETLKQKDTQIKSLEGALTKIQEKENTEGSKRIKVTPSITTPTLNKAVLMTPSKHPLINFTTPVKETPSKRSRTKY